MKPKKQKELEEEAKAASEAYQLSTKDLSVVA